MNRFLITTYNRQASCQRLVDSLQGLGDILVVNDDSNYTINGCKQFIVHPHRGKNGYWDIVNILFRLRGQYKYFFMLPDDFIPVDNMVERAIALWESINDPKKICLNLDGDRQGEMCWTDFQPQDLGNVWLSQWVDMCFMCEITFFNVLGIIPRRKPLPYRSSGVGMFISRKLYNSQYNLYHVKEALAVPTPEHSTSQMNPFIP